MKGEGERKKNISGWETVSKQNVVLCLLQIRLDFLINCFSRAEGLNQLEFDFEATIAASERFFAAEDSTSV